MDTEDYTVWAASAGGLPAGVRRPTIVATGGDVCRRLATMFVLACRHLGQGPRTADTNKALDCIEFRNGRIVCHWIRQATAREKAAFDLASLLTFGRADVDHPTRVPREDGGA